MLEELDYKLIYRWANFKTLYKVTLKKVFRGNLFVSHYFKNYQKVTKS